MMPRLFLFAGLASLIAILIWLVIPPKQEPNVLLKEKEEWAEEVEQIQSIEKFEDVKSYSKAPTSELLSALEDTKQNGLDKEDRDKVVSKAKKSIDEEKLKLDQLVKDFQKEPTDSEQYMAWKNAMLNCTKSYRSSIDKLEADEESRESLYNANIEYKKCTEQAKPLKEAITDQSEREEAEKKDAETSIILGALTVVAGILMAIYGVPAMLAALGVTAIKTIAGGMLLLGLGLDSDGQRAQGGMMNQQSQTPGEQETVIPQELKNKGYEAKGKNKDGTKRFLASDQGWIVFNVPNQSVEIEVKYQDMSGSGKLISSHLEALGGADISLKSSSNILIKYNNDSISCDVLLKKTETNKWVADCNSRAEDLQ